MINKILSKPYLALSYSAFILVLCVLPSKDLPGNVNDKFAHIMAFAGISFLWSWVIKNNWMVFLGTLVFGYLIEIIQHELPESFHRSYDLQDLYADGVGAMLGIVFYIVVKRINFFSKN